MISEYPSFMEPKFVRFDVAMKRLLADKSNFPIIEGLISVLLEQTVLCIIWLLMLSIKK